MADTEISADNTEVADTNVDEAEEVHHEAITEATDLTRIMGTVTNITTNKEELSIGEETAIVPARISAITITATMIRIGSNALGIQIRTITIIQTQTTTKAIIATITSRKILLEEEAITNHTQRVTTEGTEVMKDNIEVKAPGKTLR